VGSFGDHLRQEGLLPSTREKYKSILAGAPKDQLVDWIRGKVHARTPVGTVLPMRAAVKHYLVSVKGYDPDEVAALLPKAKGRQASQRAALTAHQLAVYLDAVERLPEPARTILALLPVTGLRIGEITSLKRSELLTRPRPEMGRMSLRFRGKGDKERLVPLPRSAEWALTSYLLDHYQDSTWLFPGYSGRPITPHAIRKYTRKLAAENPELAGLTPHVLRHTFATLALRKGVDLKRLQVLLGHKNIATTQRYLHPGEEDLREAMDRLD
jgi:site-specific recombinase XerD